MFTKSLLKKCRIALLAGGLIAAIAFAAAPIAGADRIDEVFSCNTAGSSFKDCCEKAGGDYWTTVKNGHVIEGCTIDESQKAVLKDSNGQLQIVGVDGNNIPLPTRATIAPLPPGATNFN